MEPPPRHLFVRRRTRARPARINAKLTASDDVFVHPQFHGSLRLLIHTDHVSLDFRSACTPARATSPTLGELLGFVSASPALLFYLVDADAPHHFLLLLTASFLCSLHASVDEFRLKPVLLA
jgi:hypothetical protein